MQKAKVLSVDWANTNTRQIEVVIDAKNSWFVQEPNSMGFPSITNSGPLVEGINLVLEFGHEAIQAIKGNTEFQTLVAENRQLRKGIKQSELAQRVRQFLTSLDYAQLTDFQGKCALLVEQQLK